MLKSQQAQLPYSFVRLLLKASNCSVRLNTVDGVLRKHYDCDKAEQGRRGRGYAALR
jgi:hypothetical protein